MKRYCRMFLFVFGIAVAAIIGMKANVASCPWEGPCEDGEELWTFSCSSDICGNHGGSGVCALCIS